MKNTLIFACALLSLNAYSAPSNKFTCYIADGDGDDTVYVDLNARGAAYSQEDSIDVAFYSSLHVLDSGETLFTFKSRDTKTLIEFALPGQTAKVKVDGANVAAEFACKDDPGLNLIPDLIPGNYENKEGCKVEISCWEVEIRENDKLFCNAKITESSDTVELLKADSFRAADGIRIRKVTSTEGEAPITQSGTLTLSEEGVLTAELSRKVGNFEQKLKCENLRPIL
jgi:hypothetical protein